MGDTSTNGRVGCPFLGLSGDPTTFFAYASSGNYCHRVTPPERVALSQQETTCLCVGYASCPVSKDGWQGRWPGHLRGRPVEVSGGRVRRPVVLLAVLAGLIVVGSIAGLIWGYLNRAGMKPPTASHTATYTLFVSAGLPSPTSSPTLVIPSVTPTAPNPTLAASPTPTSPPSATPVPATPTPGPAWGTPFGPDEVYVIHKVLEGESLPYLVSLYQTSEEVLYAANDILMPGRSLQPGDMLVILRGRTDPAGVPRFRIVFVSQPIRLSELAGLHGASEDDLRHYNSLGPDEWVPGGRWLIVPLVG